MKRINGLLSASLFTLAILLVLPTTAMAATPSLPEMIDQAGAQRMLSQRIVKAYSQLVIDVDKSEARSQLKEAVTRFGEQLKRLEQNAPNDDVRTALSNVRRLWGPFKSIATGPANREGMLLLSNSDGKLLAAAHDVVIKLQNTSGMPQAQLVNTAGRQRMLSQRIAKLYVLISSGIQDAGIREELQRARYEFEGAMADLKSAPENTLEIQQGLAEVERQWIVFRMSFQLKDDEHIPLLVTRSAEKILNQMHRVTGMYAQLDAR
ncbi:type IV pili methyl-accepting chemotaxis transducer N-terminal domain-containing protein [Thiohalomonas denitrificans]|uniref:Type IV pili methyl-accepting chemotaxis transducer N-term n=1 Tax=Thiohalomonas denitrificans TaxID=415747 RepID=A0A1G5PWL1_9GAMM|nr:type IV pili methyl-accepting chemotaxis transducer N-terminal domain-containing protein [Thiohalomonas denitrificans]SCZ53581.1 Type IV pili methyl-accepting chemotaxis transducer N-term [Thiohalomonas denitrificans]